MEPPLAPSVERIHDIAQAFWKAKALMSAVELDLFTCLAEDGPLDRSEIQVRVGLHERGARDFLDALVALNLLDRDAAGRYSNTPDSESYLDRRKPSYHGGFITMCNRRLYPAWLDLTNALRTGASVHPQDSSEPDFYQRVYESAESRAMFLSGMTGSTRAVAAAMIDRFRFERVGTVLDVGCAEGCLLVEIAKRHPQIRCVGFDLPAVESSFNVFVRDAGVQDRVTFLPGNFRADAFPAADVIVFGRVLHNWNLADKRALLRKAHDALPPDGRAIVYERLIDDERRHNATALLASLNMLVVTAEGFDFTGADCIGWLREAGFRDAVVEPLAASHSMVVGVA
jgi:SAM-dependent methyltransferase